MFFFTDYRLWPYLIELRIELGTEFTTLGYLIEEYTRLLIFKKMFILPVFSPTQMKKKSQPTRLLEPPLVLET